jgi:spore maturation protein CgeB
MVGVPFARIGGLVGTDKFLTNEDYAREIATSKIVVNTQTMPTRIQLKGRVSQVISCGTFLLEQDNHESRKYLEGVPVVFWSQKDELVEKIKFYLENDAERERIAVTCRQEWIKRYSVQKFARVLLGADKC